MNHKALPTVVLSLFFLAPITSASANDKALRVNLDPTKYGTFAEIGAGQETANNFFYAGASAGRRTVPAAASGRSSG